jgi:protein gp37
LAWSGSVRLNVRHLYDTLHWRKPTLIAAGWHSDWALLPAHDIDAVLAVTSREHRYLTLTKRPAMLLDTLGGGDFLSHVWIGVSLTNQDDADTHREAMALFATMGWNTYAFLEPMLGPISLAEWQFLRWVVSGGETGPYARPMHPLWARDVRDQCAAAGVPFFFKQWGEWSPECADFHKLSAHRYSRKTFAWGKDGREYNPVNPGPDDFPKTMFRVGKRAAGHLLDGKEWRQLPSAGYGVSGFQA